MQPINPQLFTKYCIDTNIFLDFWNTDDPNLRLPIDLHRSKWQFLVDSVERGEILAPTEIRDELVRNNSNELLEWVQSHSDMFIDCLGIDGFEDSLSIVVNAYPAYTAERGDLGDSILIAMAKSLGLIVLSAEYRVTPHSPNKPKIPNVCDDPRIDVNCVNFSQFLRNENYSEPVIS